jgi:hypothetical protein
MECMADGPPSAPALAKPRGGAFSGATLVIVATGLVGITGYVITWLVPRVIGVEAYATFAVFWSFTFLLTAALSGAQQEVTRATHALPAGTSAARRGPALFAAVAAALVFVVIVASSPLWMGATFADEGFSLVLPLAVSATAYVAVAVLVGTLYGLEFWGAIFCMIVIDGFLRLALIGIVLAFSHDPVLLGWAVAIPFPVTPIVVWIAVRSRVRGRTELDVGYRRLSWNAARTVTASAAMGLMVSGFPLLLGVTSAGEAKATFGLVVLAATLTRAPLIVVGMALQSYLIVFFRNHASSFWRSLLLLESFVLVVGAVLAALGWWLGPPVFELLFPGQAAPQSWFIAVLVASSALVGALCVTAPAVLSRARHSVFTAGWVVAALATIGFLILPIPFLERTVLALLFGPVCGLLVHTVYLIAAARRPEPETGTPKVRVD